MNDDTVLLSMMDRHLTEIRRKMDREADAAAASRSKMHETLGEHSRTLVEMQHRIAAVERSVSEASPTLEEFREYKARVRGAGQLGRTLWQVGALVLSAAAALYAARHKLLELWQWLIR